jgi:hypothetical protein
MGSIAALHAALQERLQAACDGTPARFNTLYMLQLPTLPSLPLRSATDRENPLQEMQA